MINQVDLRQYRESESEKKRTEDLLRLIRPISSSGTSVLDVGARDGHFSLLLTEFYDEVTALDLEVPCIAHKKVTCVQGDITNLTLPSRSFDLVFCTEVLEHIPPHLLAKACTELDRVSKEYVLIGVPYKQDTRVGRTTCYSCGRPNPPWGHVNRFTESKLQSLFPSFDMAEFSFVGENNAHTNFLSSKFMDWAGNPYGTYDQEEGCIHCGASIRSPEERTFLQKVITRAAFALNGFQKPFCRAHPSWIHILFKRKSSEPPY